MNRPDPQVERGKVVDRESNDEVRSAQTSPDSPMMNAFRIDLESSFNILDVSGAPKIERWGDLEDRETTHARRLLDLLEHHEVRATCFVLGWTAEHRPRLLEEVAEHGHEITCHGYAHQLLYEMTPEQFREDLGRSKALFARPCCRRRGKRPRSSATPRPARSRRRVMRIASGRPSSRCWRIRQPPTRRARRTLPSISIAARRPHCFWRS